MKLTHVAVEGCGRFGKPARIEGLGPGVNILSAGNEAGKSTLFRAIRTCLFERHGSSKEEIAALATEGLSLPVTITVGFEKNGKSYEIRKSFLRAKSAVLSCGGEVQARNAEADEEVWKLLGIEPRSTRAVDEAAYGILWVAQGHSFATPEPTEGARSAFNQVIQQEVGTLVGGERARLLLNGVTEELARYLTIKTDKPRANGPLDMAIRQRDQLMEQRIEAEGQLDGLRLRLDELDRLRKELRGVSDPAALQQLQDQLEGAKARLAEAERAAEALNRLVGDERQAHDLAASQRERLDALTARATGIDELRQRLKALAAELAPLDDQQAEAARALQEASGAKAAHDAEWTALEAREAELQRLETLRQQIEKRSGLEQRLALLEDFRSRAAANEAALKAASVDEAAITALTAIEEQEARIGAAQEAGAARVVIEARPGAAVTLDGASVSGHASRPVTAPLAITIGSDVTVTVSPPPGASEAAAAALAAEREKRAALLLRHAVGSAQELRQRRADRVALEQEARDLRSERSALGLKDGGTGAEIERLAAAIAAITAEARQLLPEGRVLPPPAEAAAEREALAARRGTLRTARSTAEGRIAELTAALTSLAASRGRLSGQIQAIHGQVETALAQLPDQHREQMIADCRAELERRTEAHRIKAAALERERATAPSPEEAERQRIRVARFSDALETQKRTAAELGERIARLEGEVQIAGGDGLGERAATLELQHDMAAAEAERLSSRVDVLKHLRKTVQDCYDRRRAELNAPLLRHLRPFLNDVFPEAQLSLGENFSVSALNRAGPAAELFGRLSLGTQEQVAVLVRLAMGAMIAERGEDVPVILDDALVFSDDSRIEQMFDAIARAGRNQQVIVFTCRARSFASLGGRQLRIA